MENISLTLGKHPRTEPINQVTISWSKGISVQRLKNYLEYNVPLNAFELCIWNKFKDKKNWLYCFMGRIDDEQTVNECYSYKTISKEDLTFYSRFNINDKYNRVTIETDIRLDFGKVELQTIETRIGQHFDKDDYLEKHRREAVICFPEYIVPYDNNELGDYIDSLETILIKGHDNETSNRMGVCNDNKTKDPKLNYPIKKVCNISYYPAIENEIVVTIDK